MKQETGWSSVPRFAEWTNADSSRSLVSHNKDLHDVWFKRDRFVDEEIINDINTQSKGYFYLGRTMVGFADEDDAVFFKLKYGR